MYDYIKQFKNKVQLIIWMLKENLYMVDLYVALIIAGRRTFVSIPDRFKESVKADLYALGLDETGSPLLL